MPLDRMKAEAMVNERPGLESAYELFSRGYDVVLIAPTGYGKTVLSLKLMDAALEKGLSAGLIHVAPYRALVREIYLEKFAGTPGAGWQMHGSLVYEDKSPYYLRRLVVTTLDSFVYNLYRIPVAEMRKIIKGKTQGHYYPVLASIFTSTVVFDEAHSYLDEPLAKEHESLRTLYAALRYLSYMEVPIVVETATMRSGVVLNIVKILEEGGRSARVVYVGGDRSRQVEELRKRLGEKLDVVRDPAFNEKHGFNWRTELIADEDVAAKIVELCSGEAVLVVRNTVRKAVETYQEVKSRCKEAVLIHGLISEDGKEMALKKAKEILRRRGGAIVSTQVVEAGVEIGGSVLITDAAPIESLAQRAGRLCRETYGYAEACREGEARVLIVKGGDAAPYLEEDVEGALCGIKETLSKGRGIEWRLLEDREGYVSFSTILERRNGSNIEPPRFDVHLDYLKSDSQPRTLIELMRGFGVKLIDRGYLVVVAIPKNAETIVQLRDGGIHLRNAAEIKHYFELVSVDLKRLITHEERRRGTGEECLPLNDKNQPMLLVAYTLGGKGVVVKQKHSKKALGTMKEINHEHASRLLEPSEERPEGGPVAETYLLAKPSCYDKELGLRIWG